MVYDQSKNMNSDSSFMQAMIYQIRALDPYGTMDNLSTDEMFEPFIIEKSKRKKIPVVGNMDHQTKSRIFVFYNTIASMIEKETEVMVSVIMDLSDEGFGRVLVYCGRLIVLNRTFRDAHRFGFDSLEKLINEGNKLVQSGKDAVKQFEEVARA